MVRVETQAHEFFKKLKAGNQSFLYEVNAANKRHEIWKRDPLIIEIYSRWVAIQKLHYIHRNPVAKKSKLARDEFRYFWSSRRFYKFCIDEFGFLNNLFQVFDGN